MKDKKKIIGLIAISIIFIALIVLITIKYTPVFTKMFKSPQAVDEFIKSYGSLSTLVFIGLQILQVVIAAIPGEIVQIAGGYIYGSIYGSFWGVFWGSFYSMLGILIGAIIVFFTTRVIGFQLVKIFVSKEKLEKFDFLIKSKKSEMFFFLLFLIPGIPKDILVYISGLTPIKPLRFFMIYFIARMPGIIGSAVIGVNLKSKNYTIVYIVSIISVVLFLLGVVLKDKIMDKLHKKSL